VRLPLLAAILLLLVLGACGDDDDAPPRAAGASTTTSRADCELPEPSAADGTPASVVATVGDVQVAIVDHGASVDVVSLFRGCNLTPVLLGGATAALPIGGTVTHGDGMRCTGDRITILSATSDDGATYQATTTTYRLDGADLIEVDKSASTIEAQQDPDALRPYYELDC
jgi:hypothetical protein